ncbi:MAG: EamA family transporter, partial [Rhodospirillaceae bacterium]|nr:EamA family transporter [Rhodospirillaceae bacterium]
MAANNTARGIAYMCLAVGLFPFLNAAVKVLGETYAVQQVLWLRYLGHFVLMLVIFLPFHGAKLFKTQNLGAQLLRSLLLLGSTTCYFTALNYLPLTTAASISFTSPFIVTALSVPLLGERVGPRRWTAVAIGFIGALIIIRPAGAAFHGAELFVVASATFYSFYQIMTRRLAGRDSPATTIIYTAVFGAILTSFVAPFHWQMPVVQTDWLLFAATGVVGGGG